jgi:hypothetical protein
MTKLTVAKQSLLDWTVEDEKHTVLAWIERKKGKVDGGKSYFYYQVRYSKNLGDGGEHISHDFALNFFEAKTTAFKTITEWLNYGKEQA